MKAFEYSSIPSGSLVNTGGSFNRRPLSSGPGWFPVLASLVLVETARGAVLLFAASAAYEDKEYFWSLTLAYNIGRTLSIAFLSYIVSLGCVSGLLYSMNAALVLSLGALFGGFWAHLAVLVAGLASGSSPAAVASVLVNLPGPGLAESTPEGVSPDRTIYKAAAMIVAVQQSVFASGPLIASAVFSAAAGLAPVLWPQLSVLILLCAVALVVSGAVCVWLPRQEVGGTVSDSAPIAPAPAPDRALRRKPSSFGVVGGGGGGSSARLNDLGALNPAGRAAKAAVETYEAITEIADVNHLFLLAEPLYIALAHVVQHRAALDNPAAVSAAACAVLASVGCVAVAADRPSCTSLRGSLLQGAAGVSWSAASLCIVSGLSIGGVLLIATLAYSSAPPTVLIAFDATLRLFAEPCVRWGVLVSAAVSSFSYASSYSPVALGSEGGAAEWELTRALLFKRIQFQLSLVSIICFVTQMIMHS